MLVSTNGGTIRDLRLDLSSHTCEQIVDLFQGLNGSVLRNLDLFMPQKIDDEVFETIFSKLDQDSLSQLNVMGASQT